MDRHDAEHPAGVSREAPSRVSFPLGTIRNWTRAPKRMTKKRCLYLANFDPAESSTGTTIRGGLFLDRFAGRYETHLVHFAGSGEGNRNTSLVASLSGIDTVPWSNAEFFVFSRRFMAAAERALENSHFDFIFADCEKAGLYGHLLSRRHGIPYFYNSHNVEYQRYISLAQTNKLRYLFVPYIYLAERAACRHATLTFSISESDASILSRWTGDARIVVLPCAFDESVYNPFYDEPQISRPVVLMVGNFGYGANRESAYRLVRKTVPEVVGVRPDVIFRFVGREFPDELVGKNVEAAGLVEDLKGEYERASIVIAPIEIGGGVKIKVVEALACGKFLLTTEKGMEGIDPSGLENVRVVSSDSFAKHIIEALERGPAKTTANWDIVATRFGKRRALDTLVTLLDQTVDSRLSKVKAPHA